MKRDNSFLFLHGKNKGIYHEEHEGHEKMQGGPWPTLNLKILSTK